MYYSRKLCCYNFTVYEGALPNCYVWTEVYGKRGSNEIGSCLYRYINTLDKNITGYHFFLILVGARIETKMLQLFLCL